MPFLHAPLPRLIVQIAAIVLMSRLLGVLAKRWGQPMVVAEISAGILLGPSFLGALAPGLSHALFAPESLQPLKLTSELGLIFFMFLVGIEFNVRALRGRAHTSVAISHASIVVPFALGAGLAYLLRERLLEPGASVRSFGLFMGAAMSITAFPVLARILSEQRLLSTRVGVITLMCAAVDDVSAWCILALVVGIARAHGVGSALRTLGLLVGYVVLMLAVVRPLLRTLWARGSRFQAFSQNAFAFTVLLLLGSCCITEWIGIHALFGAFVLGTVLPKGELTGALADKLEGMVLVVLLPMFFAYSGVRTQLGLLTSASDWAICAVIIAVACAGKFGASTLVARLTGLSWRESSALGVLMNTRGLMELIVLNVGLDLGVIGPLAFTVMVVMALVTTFMTTPLLRLIFGPEPLAYSLARASGVSAD